MTVTAERLKTYYANRATLVTEHRALLDAVDIAQGLTAEQRATDERMNARLDDLDRMIETENRNLERERQGAAHGDSLGDEGRRGGYAEMKERQTAEVRSWLLGAKTQPLELAHGGSFTGRAQDYLDEIRSFGDDIEARALTVGTAASGGNLVTQAFADKLYEHMIEDAVLLNEVSIVTTQTGEPMTFPKTTAHPDATSQIAENTAISQTDPTFGKLTLGAYKYGDLLLAPRELIEDTSFDLLGYLARRMGRAVGNALGAKIVAGAGTTEPRGITIDSTLGVTGAASVAGLFTADDLIDLEYAVAEAYAIRAKFLARRATVGKMRKLKDSGGQYLWSAAVMPGARDTFDGQSIIQDPNVAAVALDAKSVLFGDYSAYQARLVRGIRFERSDDRYFDTDQVAFRAVVRGDGGLLDLTGAVKHYIGNAA